MNEAAILNGKKAIEERYGPWTAHNFSLGKDIFTMKTEVAGDEVKLRRVAQIVSDVSNRPVGDLHILDLACLEGMYSIEFAQQGARVCAIEGRKANIEKARFAAQILSLSNVDFYQDDVRNLSEEKYGSFDVVLCLGILYHLNAPDLFSFLEKVFNVCRSFVVIDTHISLYPEESFQHSGRLYWGKTVLEHPPNTTVEEKQKKLWASLDNPTSVYLTHPSLCCLLTHVGFTSVYECHIPEEPEKPENRVTFLAIKGKNENLATCPQLQKNYAREFKEAFPQDNRKKVPSVRPGWRILGMLLPHRLKDLLKRILFSV